MDTYKKNEEKIYLSFLTTGFSIKQHYPYYVDLWNHEEHYTFFLEDVSLEKNFYENIKEVIQGKDVIHYAGEQYFFPMFQYQLNRFSIKSPDYHSIDLFEIAKDKKTFLPIKRVSRESLSSLMNFPPPMINPKKCAILYKHFQKGKKENPQDTFSSMVENQLEFIQNLESFLSRLEKNLTYSLSKDYTATIASIREENECTIYGSFYPFIEDFYYTCPEFTWESTKQKFLLRLSTQEGEKENDLILFHDGYYLRGIEKYHTQWKISPNIFFLQENGVWNLQEIFQLMCALWSGLRKEIL